MALPSGQAPKASYPVVELYKHYITCANPHAITSIPDPFPLGPFDVFVPISIPVAVIWVYRPRRTVDSSSFIPVERLQRALALLLDFYPQLTGRLKEDSLGNRRITALGSGAIYSTARCELDLGRGFVNMSDLPGESNELFIPFISDPQEVSNGPIVSIKHTRFLCGSVALGVRCLHTVCDATGLCQLMEDLAEVYDGMGRSDAFQLARQPTIIPYMSTPLDPTAALTAREFKSGLFNLVSHSAVKTDASADVQAAIQAPAKGRFFRYSSSQLRAIKAEASADLPPGEYITTFDALSAHLHRCVYIARQRLYGDRPELGALSPPDLLSPVNMRLRPGPAELHNRYFPQALFTTYTTFDTEILLHGPLSSIALSVHRMVRNPATTSPSETRHTLEWLSAQTDKTNIQNGFRYGSGESNAQRME